MTLIPNVYTFQIIIGVVLNFTLKTQEQSFEFLSKYLFSLSRFKVYKNLLNKILFIVLRSSCLELCVAVFNILKYLGVVMNYHWAILLVVSFCQPESLERT